MTEYIMPPEIDDETYGRAASVAVKAYEALRCSGAARVDLLIPENGDIYVLEVNTIPGLTETSLLPKIAGSAGLGFPELMEEMLRLALD